MMTFKCLILIKQYLGNDYYIVIKFI